MSAKLRSAKLIRPAQFQSPLPVDRLILKEAPDSEAVPMDVVFVGGGPAGLAGAIELARLVSRDNEREGGLGDIEIGVLEKASQLGEHSLSGAVASPTRPTVLLQQPPDERRCPKNSNRLDTLDRLDFRRRFLSTG